MFNGNLFNLNHSEIFYNSLLIISFKTFKFLCLKNKFVSSANIMKLASFEEFTMSFMYTIKSRGPKIEPWGTPHFIG
jgi:hypothetical protein